MSYNPSFASPRAVGMPVMPPRVDPQQQQQQQQQQQADPQMFRRRSRASKHQPLLHSSLNFVAPSRMILEGTDMTAWTKSETYLLLVEFIWGLNESVLKKKASDSVMESQIVTNIVSMLNSIDTWIDETPIPECKARFGNPAYRTWHARLEQHATELMSKLLPESLHGATVELIPYLLGGFGHPIRLDYGSGHELSFTAWMCALDTLGLIQDVDYAAVVLRVYTKYFEVCRKLQTIFKLEPAGSHGVWGLDDYQFLPFLWGSAQLIDHPHIKPKSIMNVDIVDTFSKEFMYLRCIQFVRQIKKGPFHEHSPMLYDISGVATWTKVNTGLMKMYLVEVMGKFPVVQHIVFGSILPWAQTATHSSHPKSESHDSSVPASPSDSKLKENDL